MHVRADIYRFRMYLWISSSVKWPNYVRQIVLASNVLTTTPSKSRVHPQHCTICLTVYLTQTNRRRGTEDSICNSAEVAWKFWILETTLSTVTDWTSVTRRSRLLPTMRGDLCSQWTGLICLEIVSLFYLTFSSWRTSRSGGYPFTATPSVVSASSAGCRRGWNRSALPCTCPTPCCATLLTGSVEEELHHWKATTSVEILTANGSSTFWRCVMLFAFLLRRSTMRKTHLLSIYNTAGHNWPIKTMGTNWNYFPLGLPENTIIV